MFLSSRSREPLFVNTSKTLDVALWQGGACNETRFILPFVSLMFCETSASAMCPTEEVEGVQKKKLGFPSQTICNQASNSNTS